MPHAQLRREQGSNRRGSYLNRIRDSRVLGGPPSAADRANPARRTLDSDDGSHLLVLKAGDSFGDASVLGDQRWASAWGINADFHAMEDSHISYIYTKDILELLEQQPRFDHIRRRFQKLASRIEENREEWSEDYSGSNRAFNPVAVFRWSMCVQLLIRSASRNNDFSEIASSVGKTGASVIPQLSAPKLLRSLSGRSLSPRRTSREGINIIHGFSTPPHTPQGPGRHRGSSPFTIDVHQHKERRSNSEVSAYCELGTVDSTSGVFRGL